MLFSWRTKKFNNVSTFITLAWIDEIWAYWRKNQINSDQKFVLEDIIVRFIRPRDTASDSSKSVLVKMSCFDFALERGNNTEFDFQLPAGLYKLYRRVYLLRTSTLIVT